MRLVYLSPVPLASFAQRPHHFVQWFHERFDAPVLWIDPTPARLARWSDLRRLRPAPKPRVDDDGVRRFVGPKAAQQRPDDEVGLLGRVHRRARAQPFIEAPQGRPGFAL